MTVLHTVYLTEGQENEMLEWLSDHQSLVEQVGLLPPRAWAGTVPFMKGGHWRVRFHEACDEVVYFLLKWC